jgi:hypothetical protein
VSFSFKRLAAHRLAPSAGLVLAFSLVVAASALAANRIPFKANAADQAAARLAVVHRADLGAGWTGGSTKPQYSSDTGCADWKPKQSDLLITGAAASTFQTPGLFVESEVDVLQSAQMVTLDWQRTAIDPHAIGCMRKGLAKAINSAKAKLVSVNPRGFPHLTSQTLAFRALIDVTSNGSTHRVIYDMVAIGAGRNELTLLVTGAYASQTAVRVLEVQLARLLTARLPK